MRVMFYIPNKDFYDKLYPFLKEKRYCYGAGSQCIRPIKEQSFYLAITHYGFMYVYKDLEIISKIKNFGEMRFFPFETENINFI